MRNRNIIKNLQLKIYTSAIWPVETNASENMYLSVREVLRTFRIQNKKWRFSTVEKNFPEKNFPLFQVFMGIWLSKTVWAYKIFGWFERRISLAFIIRSQKRCFHWKKSTQDVLKWILQFKVTRLLWSLAPVKNWRFANKKCVNNVLCWRLFLF